MFLLLNTIFLSESNCSTILEFSLITHIWRALNTSMNLNKSDETPTEKHLQRILMKMYYLAYLVHVQE